MSIDAASTLRAQLAGFLANLPGLDDPRVRHELLRATGFGYLEAGIDFAGSNVVFVSGLLAALAREGQAALPAFLTALGGSSSFVLGGEDRQRLAALSSGIAAMPAERWRAEFAPGQGVPPPPAPAPGSAPTKPALIIGRDDDLLRLKGRFGIAMPGAGAGLPRPVTVLRGWPGVGKTTVAAALANDPDVVREQFPDGVLWASLGQQPSLTGEVAAWGRALGVPDVGQARSLEEAAGLLRGLLRNKRTLLIVDDAWQAEHVRPFNAGGSGCALLVTTRLPEVARAVAPTPDDVYVLGVLSEADALQLLRTLAPGVVAENEEVSRELVRDLEGLPLAIQVAGRLLEAEASYGFSVSELLAAIRAGAELIKAQAPADRAEVGQQTTPTVAALLSKSTDLLDPDTRDCFAYLGVFAPKPATFDTRAMQSVWQVEDPRPTVRILVDRGLLEPSGQGRFWMHALLVAHAKSLLST